MSLSTAYLNTNNGTNSISQLASLIGSSSTADSSSADSTSSSSSSASTASLSSTAKLLQQLQQLEKSNPAEFKKVAADIAKQLRSAAATVGGSQGQALSDLAAKFQQASQSGNLSSFAPKHHHHGGSGASSQQSSGASAYQSASDGNSQDSIASQLDSIISSVFSQDLGTSTNATASTLPTTTAAS